MDRYCCISLHLLPPGVTPGGSKGKLIRLTTRSRQWMWFHQLEGGSISPILACCVFIKRENIKLLQQLSLHLGYMLPTYVALSLIITWSSSTGNQVATQTCKTRTNGGKTLKPLELVDGGKMSPSQLRTCCEKTTKFEQTNPELNCLWTKQRSWGWRRSIRI